MFLLYYLYVFIIQIFAKYRRHHHEPHILNERVLNSNQDLGGQRMQL